MINVTRFIAENPNCSSRDKGISEPALNSSDVPDHHAVYQPDETDEALSLDQNRIFFTAGFPVEFARAFGVFPYYPEAYAALTGAAESTQPSIEHAESLGYSRDLCSYMKTSIGASRMGLARRLRRQ